MDLKKISLNFQNLKTQRLVSGRPMSFEEMTPEQVAWMGIVAVLKFSSA